MKRSILILLLAEVLFLSMVPPVVEAKHYVTVPCTVLRVIDGDTIEVGIPSYAEVNEKENLQDTPYGGLLSATEILS